jgi:hypothetical protein
MHGIEKRRVFALICLSKDANTQILGVAALRVVRVILALNQREQPWLTLPGTEFDGKVEFCGGWLMVRSRVG